MNKLIKIKLILLMAGALLFNPMAFQQSAEAKPLKLELNTTVIIVLTVITIGAITTVAYIMKDKGNDKDEKKGSGFDYEKKEQRPKTKEEMKRDLEQMRKGNHGQEADD